MNDDKSALKEEIADDLMHVAIKILNVNHKEANLSFFYLSKEYSAKIIVKREENQCETCEDDSHHCFGGDIGCNCDCDGYHDCSDGPCDCGDDEE